MWGGIVSSNGNTPVEVIVGAVLAQFIENYGHNRVALIAWVLSFRGEADHAFERLDKAARNIDAELVTLVTGGFFFKIHDDPRWLPFLESIGLSPSQLDANEFNVTLPEYGVRQAPK